MIQMPNDYNKYIYHFTKSKTALLYILPNFRLKLSSFLDSNDPKENKTFGFWSILENINEFNKSKIKQEFQAYLAKNCKHLCFSTDYQEKGYFISGFNHPTMWTHYAENSKGICLVINKERFISENDSLIKDSVKYGSFLNFPKLDEAEWGKNNNDYFHNFLLKNAKELFFQKHLHWNSEDEFKFVGLGQEEYCCIKNSLAGIFIGDEFDKSLTGLLKKIVPENIGINKIYIDDGRFTYLPLIQ